MQETSPFLIELHLGSPVTWLGLALSALGVFLAYRSLRKTRKAAEAAKEAVIRLKKDIGRFESVAACASVLAMLNEIKRHQRHEAWDLLPDRYSDLRRSLSEIRGLTLLNEEQQRDIQAALVQLRGIEEQIERHLISEDGELDIPRMNKIVSRQADRITEVIISLRTELGSPHDA